MKLSRRLDMIASMVTPGYRLADIGTDHGYIPIKLVAEGVIPSAIAMDIRSGPLERASEHIAEAGLNDRIVTRLSDGMEKLKPGEVDCILIAGMGAELMTRILWDAADLKNTVKEYVLSPHTDWSLLRKTLREYACTIVDEDMVMEDGKYYVVIKAIPKADNTREERKIYDLFGKKLIVEKHPVLTEYLNKEELQYKEILNTIKSDKDEKHIERIKELEIYLEQIEEAKHEMQCDI